MTPEKLQKNFARCKDWEQKYLYIIELGERIPVIDASKQTSDYLIQGCQSQVWVDMQIDQDTQTLTLKGNSDAAIVKGLVAVVFIAFQGKTRQQVVDFDIKAWFSTLELEQQLTPTRTQGLHAMVGAIQKFALQQLS
ncbi:cysteine desulfuration protein SufE [Thaumasiovibrio subtropicus]|uniref:cysteine desulfuration protein SufE n=1 Tax=Thaumasiovibrio subtropicus TaxID=1891207 RepID=UPI000B34E2D1|nr:cysteine desulfuration protein SufE [Thaumasiovibrio subtropicus]